MQSGDRQIAVCTNRKWIKTNTSVFGDKGLEYANFLILSHHGKYDWSGFRTYQECASQEMSLRDDRFYVIVERL